MKKITLLCLSLVAAFSASASIAVCDTYPDENGNFDCPYITSGSITWNEASHTLTLDNAIVEAMAALVILDNHLIKKTNEL